MTRAGERKEAKVEAGNSQLPEGSRTVIRDVLQEAQQGVGEALVLQVEVDQVDHPPEEVGPPVARMAIDVHLLGETLRRVEGLLETKAKAKETEPELD